MRREKDWKRLFTEQTLEASLLLGTEGRKIGEGTKIEREEAPVLPSSHGCTECKLCAK